MDKDTVAVTVPAEKLYDQSEYYSFLSSLDKEVTAVVIDMKTAGGEVTYKSKQVSVQNVGAAAENAVDLASYIDTARRAGFDVIARIYAFEDSTAPYNSADMAIRYGWMKAWITAVSRGLTHIPIRRRNMCWILFMTP